MPHLYPKSSYIVKDDLRNKIFAGGILAWFLAPCGAIVKLSSLENMPARCAAGLNR